MSLTDWTTYSELHWFFAAREPSGEIDLRLQDGLEWTGSDNLGNHYEGANLGGGGNSPSWKAHAMLVPAVSADASLLTIRCTNPLDGSELLTEISLGTRRNSN